MSTSQTACTAEHPRMPGLICHLAVPHEPPHYAMGYTWVITRATLDEIARVGREWPDGIHTCAELQALEPGRRPCTCGRCNTGPAQAATSCCEECQS